MEKCIVLVWMLGNICNKMLFYDYIILYVYLHNLQYFYVQYVQRRVSLFTFGRFNKVESYLSDIPFHLASEFFSLEEHVAFDNSVLIYQQY